jgi:hypothetical protein
LYLSSNSILDLISFTKEREVEPTDAVNWGVDAGKLEGIWVGYVVSTLKSRSGKIGEYQGSLPVHYRVQTIIPRTSEGAGKSKKESFPSSILPLLHPLVIWIIVGVLVVIAAAGGFLYWRKRTQEQRLPLSMQ